MERNSSLAPSTGPAHLLKHLERDGLLRHVCVPADERLQQVELTDAGRALCSRAGPVRECIMWDRTEEPI